jgi:hypothetical protein
MYDGRVRMNGHGKRRWKCVLLSLVRTFVKRTNSYSREKVDDSVEKVAVLFFPGTPHLCWTLGNVEKINRPLYPYTA